MTTIKKIVKRDGRMVEYDVDKIAEAIFKAAQVLGGKDRDMAKYLALQKKSLSKTVMRVLQRNTSYTEQNVLVLVT